MRLLKQEYQEVGRFIRYRIGRIALGTAAAFFLLSVGIYVWMIRDEQLAKQLFDGLALAMESKGLPDSGIGLASGLFVNNFTAMGMSALLGFIPFLFLSGYVLFVNAGAMAVTMAMYTIFNLAPVWQVLAFGILPHGIFELTAFVLSVSLGFYLCKTLSSLIIKPQKAKVFKETVLDGLRLLILIIVPLLVIAALVESFITPLLLNLLA